LTTEEGKDSATYKKHSVGSSTYSNDLGQTAQISKREYYNEKGERYDPIAADPITSLETAKRKGLQEWSPVSDLRSNLDAFLYFERQVWHFIAKAEDAKNTYLQSKRNAEPWVQLHAEDFEKAIIEERKRLKINLADQRSQVDMVLFWLK
jgi:hypothetical protein